MKDMGRAMAALKERYAGKLDFGKASARGEEDAERGVVASGRALLPSPREAGRGWRSEKNRAG